MPGVVFYMSCLRETATQQQKMLYAFETFLSSQSKKLEKVVDMEVWLWYYK